MDTKIFRKSLQDKVAKWCYIYEMHTFQSVQFNNVPLATRGCLEISN